RVEGASPVTRLSSAALLFGCWMLTAEPWPIEKPCQLTMALWLVWVMLSWVAEGAAIDTLPAATLPPVGRFCASAWPITSELVSAVVASSSARHAPPRCGKRFQQRTIGLSINLFPAA